MNWQSFIHLIQKESDNTIFLKNAADSSLIGKTICGFLNTMNGKLIIGYDKVSIHLTGYEQSDQWIDQFIGEHFTNTVITSTFLFRSNKKILILDILKNPQRVPFMGKYYQIENKRAAELIIANDPVIINQPITIQPSVQPTPIQTSTPTQTSAPIQQQTFSQPNPPIQTNPEQTNIGSINQQTIETISAIQETQTSTPQLSVNEPSNQLNQANYPTQSFSDEPFESDESNMFKRQQKALNFITQEGSIKNKQYRKLFSVSHKTAHIELADLVKQEKIKISGSGRSTCYILNNQEAPKQTNDSPQLSQEKIQQIQEYLDENQQITASIYAELFNIELAQAIEELQTLSNLSLVNQVNYNNQIFYSKPTTQPLFTH